MDHIPTSEHSHNSLNCYVPLSNESMFPYLVEFCWLFFESHHHCRFHFLVTGIILMISLALWKRVYEANIMQVMRTWKLQWYSGWKNSQQNFMRQIYTLSFEVGILLLRKMVTMLRSKDVILRRPASFLCMIHAPVLVIIPVLKKKVLLFDLTSCFSVCVYVNFYVLVFIIVVTNIC